MLSISSWETIPVSSPQALSIDVPGGYDVPSKSSDGRLMLPLTENSDVPL